MKTLHLFEAFGVELEYMIVDRESLAVRPICDQLIHEVALEYASEIEMGELCWSNELCLHVVELKTNGPAPALKHLDHCFHAHVQRMNELLAPMGARLMPAAMHPFMNPDLEMRLWPHDYSAVYEAFDRIFGCKGHGWSNLQSSHLNLPFANDEEFGKLHAAIRLLLPILPALAASSPIKDGRISGIMDNRLEAYRHNARSVPSVSGRVIPEPCYTRESYEREILGRLYRDIAPHDPQGILQYEWLNARGAIARFDRSAIEIRVLDTQECPLADLAIANAITSVLRKMVHEVWASMESQQAWAVEPLERIFLATIKDGRNAGIEDRDYLAAFGMNCARCSAGDLWRHLAKEVVTQTASDDERWLSSLGVILNEGALAERIIQALPQQPTHHDICGVYRRLCECLAAGSMFRA